MFKGSRKDTVDHQSPPCISLSKEFGFKGCGTTWYHYLFQLHFWQGTACALNHVREKQSELHIPIQIGLTEHSATELCCLSRYLLENVREGRVGVPYLLRCHSVRTSKGSLGWVCWGLCNCFEDGWHAHLQALSMLLTPCFINKRHSQTHPTLFRCFDKRHKESLLFIGLTIVERDIFAGNDFLFLT